LINPHSKFYHCKPTEVIVQQLLRTNDTRFASHSLASAAVA